MAQTFTWFPDSGHSKAIEPRVTGIKFGDGYEQRVPDGINTTPERWTLTFTGGRAEIDAIDAFLKERAGAESFDWKTPDEMTGRFLCRSWTKSRERGAKVTLSCEFEQVPA